MPNKSLGGYWEFPGGKVEIDENHEEALARELYEELGMKVLIQSHFKTHTHAYDAFTIELIAYRCSFLDASYILTDHDQYEWVHPHELLQWQLAPADIPIADEIIKTVFPP